VKKKAFERIDSDIVSIYLIRIETRLESIACAIDIPIPTVTKAARAARKAGAAAAEAAAVPGGGAACSTTASSAP
jgi:hypothetical protein